MVWVCTRCISKYPLFNPEYGSIAESERKERGLCPRKVSLCWIHTKIPNKAFLWKYSETGSLSFLCIPVEFARVYNSMLLNPVLQNSPSGVTFVRDVQRYWRTKNNTSILEFELSVVSHAVCLLPVCYSIRLSVVIKRQRGVCIFIRSMKLCFMYHPTTFLHRHRGEAEV